MAERFVGSVLYIGDEVASWRAGVYILEARIPSATMTPTKSLLRISKETIHFA